MKKIMIKLAGSQISRSQNGFTLVELLVVVAIIVALAAVIVPLVIQFADKGEEGAAAAELDTVQTAMDAAMADQLVVAVTAATGATSSVDDFTATPTEIRQAPSAQQERRPHDHSLARAREARTLRSRVQSGQFGRTAPPEPWRRSGPEPWR